MNRIEQFLEECVSRGGFRIGQVVVRADRSMRHADDATADPADLRIFSDPDAAVEIARWDGSRKYRPLKSAPNLAAGWEIRPATVGDLRLALDYLYPAAVGTWVAYRAGEVTPVPLRDTLGRQTGMYRITQLARDDQLVALVGSACESRAGCLRRILWPIRDGEPHALTEASVDAAPGEIPVLCAEACNLLVAACRPLGKENLPKT